MANLLLATTGGAIVDLVALSIIVVLTVLGIKYGFVKTFVTTFGTLISFLLSALLCSVVANFLERQYGFVSTISVWLNGALSELFGPEIMDTTLEQATQNGLQNGGVAIWIVSIVLNLKGDATMPTNVTLNQIISPALAYYIACAIAFIGLFILLIIAFFIIGDLSKKLHEVKLTEMMDKTLGGILAFSESLLLIDILIIIINAIPLPFMQTVAFEIGNSVITSFLCNVNLVGLLFELITNNGIINFIKSLFA